MARVQFVRKDIGDAIDTLSAANAEAMVLISLLTHELSPDPESNGFTYGLNSEQTDMLHHMAHAVHRSVQKAMDILEVQS